MGYVATEFSKVGTEIYIDIRNTLVKAQVVKFPFK
jgi:aminomethyltransferase